jgi:maltose O-acetyltransferase
MTTLGNLVEPAARSEKSKMLAGELYLASDPELVAERLRAQDLLRIYNATRGFASLEELFGALGDNGVVEPVFACDYGYNIRAGRNLFVNYGCVFLDCAPVVIGDDVQIGPAAQLYTAAHPLDPAQRRRGIESARPIRIGDGAWIGGGAIVLPGVGIGDEAVIAAGSVVTRDVSARTVVAGNPARVIRHIAP